MKHTFIMVLDPLGIGTAEDAERSGDVGADTLGHIAEAYAKGETDNDREDPSNLSNPARPGLTKACEGSIGLISVGMDGSAEAIGAYAWVHGMSPGKDTLSGHWEIAGVPVLFEWEYFSGHENSPPQELLDKLVERVNLPDYLGDCHSSGTATLGRPGGKHMKIGKPIFYTSVDSVFQTAYHEETFGLDKLHELYEVVREELTDGGYNIGRVIIRPLIGDKTGNSQHTDNCHDLAAESSAPTVLQKLVDEKHGQVVSVGRIADIYVNYGITKKVKAAGLDALFDATIKEMEEAGDNTVVFISFVNFDFSRGRRRDITGYAVGLELFSRCLSEPMSLLRDDDVLILAADYGYGPTWTGTDRMRECIPVLVHGPRVKPGSLGHRETFTDIGQTLVKYFGTSDMEYDKAMS